MSFPKKNKSIVLLSSLHHDSVICRDSGKTEIIEFYNKTKGSSRHVGLNVYKIHSTTSNSQVDNGNILRHDQHYCSKCIGHIRAQHAQRSARVEDKNF